jgi:hypothetical protein
MKRKILEDLLIWKQSKRRKPLILSGARQVGKTYILKIFGESNFSRVVNLNFEENPRIVSCFENSLDPSEIIKKIEILTEEKIDPASTLLIFDEIQICSSALTSLKYFCEKAPHYYIVCAGSLLGISVANSTSFPVGKVDFLRMYPLSFYEFLQAINKNLLLEYLSEITISDQITQIFHEQLTELFRLYMFTGGMPEVVKYYEEENDFDLIVRTQQAILAAYQNDFSKYATSVEALKIRRLWDSVPKHLARENKKFIFSAVAQSARAREYETALQWLLDAGLIIKSRLSELASPPLEVTSSTDIFKIFSLDTGLLAAMTRLSRQALLSQAQMLTQFNGALLENVVAQELTVHKLSPLFYWTSSSQAEIDFLIEKDSLAFPIEVKSGLNLRSKSLQSFIKRYNPKISIRISPHNLKHTNGILELPIYMIGELTRFLYRAT